MRQIEQVEPGRVARQHNELPDHPGLALHVRLTKRVLQLEVGIHVEYRDDGSWRKAKTNVFRWFQDRIVGGRKPRSQSASTRHSEAGTKVAHLFLGHENKVRELFTC